MKKIFLSYAYSDQGIARRLSADLMARGIAVVSTHDYPPGSNVALEVSSSISGCDAFVPLLTSKSKESTLFDILLSSAISVYEGDGHFLIIPVFLERDVDPGLILDSFLGIYLTRESEYASALEALCSNLSVERSHVNYSDRDSELRITRDAIESQRIIVENHFIELELQRQKTRANQLLITALSALVTISFALTGIALAYLPPIVSEMSADQWASIQAFGRNLLYGMIGTVVGYVWRSTIATRTRDDYNIDRDKNRTKSRARKVKSEALDE